MKKSIMVMSATVLLTAANVQAADTEAMQLHIERTRSAVESLAVKAGRKETVIDDIDRARRYVDKAGEALNNGKRLLGGVKPEAEQDIRHNTAMAELELVIAESRLAREKISEELAPIDAQLARVNARIKVLEAGKAAIDMQKANMADLEAATKELVAVKTEKGLLVSQVEMLIAERKQLEKAKEELARALKEEKMEKQMLAKQLHELTGKRSPSPEKAPLNATDATPTPAPEEAPLPAAAAPLEEPTTPSVPEQSVK